jgi:hypothetical protein
MSRSAKEKMRVSPTEHYLTRREVAQFLTKHGYNYCPKAFGLIGKLIATLIDRPIAHYNRAEVRRLGPDGAGLFAMARRSVTASCTRRDPGPSGVVA